MSLKIDIIAVGALKKGALKDLCDEYSKRISSKIKLIELPQKPANEHSKIIEKIDKSAFIVAMDERGKSLKSIEFAHKLQDIQNQGVSHIQFIIGGADGLNDDIRGRADLLLSFGQQTWPHMLARVMLLEQIYRAQQINAGHPYHRE